ncbi:MAG: elongation factor Ts [Gammaproteobacteria bacterium]|nr:elongation factor Ts [Gammaproteobacteria bacterium]
MTITANQVKELREITGLGMMECKAALTECNGDQNAAIDLLRKKAGAKVEKKAGRTAAEGAIGISISADRKLAAMAEVNSETDFVAKGDDFIAFANAVAAAAARHNPADVEALKNAALDSGQTVSQAREALVMKLGENINVRRFVRYRSDNGHIGAYVHGRKIGVLVELEGGSETLARDIAMHIAASRPECVDKNQVPADIIAKEREIFTAQAAESGKPPEIVEKMVLGRINKFLGEITLLGQPFVKDPETTVEKLLKTANAKVVRFMRYEVGAGIERNSNDFAAEVMAQVKGN